MLTPEDGTGLANADSLTSVEFADIYHAERGNVLWATFDVLRKEANLRRATDYIKYIFGPSFIGVKAVAGQSLPFPRIIDYVNVGVPISIQEATAELALVADTTPLMPSSTAIRKKMVKVGSIQVEYDATSFGTGPRFIAGVSRLAEYLGGLTSGAIKTARLVRT